MYYFLDERNSHGWCGVTWYYLNDGASQGCDNFRDGLYSREVERSLSGFSPLGCWGVFRCLATTPSKSRLMIGPCPFSCLVRTSLILSLSILVIRIDVFLTLSLPHLCLASLALVPPFHQWATHPPSLYPVEFSSTFSTACIQQAECSVYIRRVLNVSSSNTILPQHESSHPCVSHTEAAHVPHRLHRRIVCFLHYDSPLGV